MPSATNPAAVYKMTSTLFPAQYNYISADKQWQVVENDFLNVIEYIVRILCSKSSMKAMAGSSSRSMFLQAKVDPGMVIMQFSRCVL